MKDRTIAEKTASIYNMLCNTAIVDIDHKTISTPEDTYKYRSYAAMTNDMLDTIYNIVECMINDI